MLLPIYLPHRVPAMVVDFGPERRGSMLARACMSHVGVDIAGVPETPATDVQPVLILAHEVFGVYGLEPRREQEVAEHDLLHVQIRRRGVRGARRGVGWRP